MPTILGILTFVSMMNTTSERLKARYFFICWYFSFYEQLKFRAQLSWSSGPGPSGIFGSDRIQTVTNLVLGRVRYVALSINSLPTSVVC